MSNTWAQLHPTGPAVNASEASPLGSRSFWGRFAQKAESWRIDPAFPVPQGSDLTTSGSVAEAPNGQTSVMSGRPIESYVPPTFDLPDPAGDFILLAKWQGRVTEVGDDCFEAIVEDQLTANPDEYAIFSVDELSEDDRILLVPGALFYWAIGYRVEPSRVRSRESVIRMQRLPTWSNEELDRARQWAQESANEVPASQ